MQLQSSPINTQGFRLLAPPLRHRYRTFLVGGAVRDSFIGVSGGDLDFVSMAPSFDALLDMLGAEGAVPYLPKPEFMTVKCNHPEYGDCDFAVARTEGAYSDGRHPDDVLLADSIEHDLSRRDFTVNAIAMDVVTGEMIDPFGGREDIQRRRIRCVGDTHARLMEDRLRILRALRLSLKLKFFVDLDIDQYILGMAANGGLEGVSSHRIWMELGKMFTYGTIEAMRLLSKYPPLMRAVFNDTTGVHLLPSLKKKAMAQ